MALDERYIVTGDLEELFRDKDSGLPLAGGTITFYRDVARNTAKTVYQLTGAPPNYSYTALPNPITLSSVGTVQNAGGDNEVIYYYPFDANGDLDLYYIVVRDSDGVEQFTREAWPNITDASDPTKDPFPVQNQISNPQFTEAFINENLTTTYTVTGATDEEFNFAPDWKFVISGTGTVVIQRIAVTGNENILTSPPYVLDITISANITACYLRQRFDTNSGLWASTSTQSIYLTGHVLARNEGAGNAGIKMLYAESSGGTPVEIIDDTVDNTGYVGVTGTTADPIPLSKNVNSGESAYIDIYLSFLPNTNVRVSSVQVVPTVSQASGDLVQYDVQAAKRERALMGDYYLPALQQKRIPSLLTGWDFPVNPTQLGSSGNVGTTGAYIWDQTIAARGSSGNVTYSRNSISGGLKFVTAGTNDAFYILQYLTGTQAQQILGNVLSVNVNGYKNSPGDDVTMKIYLYRGSSGASIPTLGTTIGTLSSDGSFTLTAANWTEISRGGLGVATTTLNVVNLGSDINNDNDYSFTGWQVTSSSEINDTDKFAIVITFAYADASTTVIVDSVNCCLGQLASRPAPQTINAVLEECEYYYQKSFAIGTIPAQSAGTSAATHSLQVVGATTAGAYGPMINFNTIMRATPSITLYNPSAANALIRNITVGNDWISSSAAEVSTKGFITTGQTSAGSAVGNAAAVHWTADARLGVV